MGSLACEGCGDKFRTVNGLAWHRAHRHGALGEGPPRTGQAPVGNVSPAPQGESSGNKPGEPWPDLWKFVKHCEAGGCEAHQSQLRELVRLVDNARDNQKVRSALLRAEGLLQWRATIKPILYGPLDLPSHSDYREAIGLKTVNMGGDKFALRVSDPANVQQVQKFLEYLGNKAILKLDPDGKTHWVCPRE